MVRIISIFSWSTWRDLESVRREVVSIWHWKGYLFHYNLSVIILYSIKDHCSYFKRSIISYSGSLWGLINDKREHLACIESGEQIDTNPVTASRGSLVFKNVFYLLYVAVLVGWVSWLFRFWIHRSNLYSALKPYHYLLYSGGFTLGVKASSLCSYGKASTKYKICKKK